MFVRDDSKDIGKTHHKTGEEEGFKIEQPLSSVICMKETMDNGIIGTVEEEKCTKLVRSPQKNKGRGSTTVYLTPTKNALDVI